MREPGPVSTDCGDVPDPAQSRSEAIPGSATRRSALRFGATALAATATSFTLRTPASAQTETNYVPIYQVQEMGPSGPLPTTIFEIQPPDTSKAPFRLVLSATNFFGVDDEVLYFGYNVAEQGGKAVDGEPSFGFIIEQDYFQSGTQHTLEAYWEFANSSNSRRYRPFFMQFNRETGAMNACQFTSPSLLFRPLPTVEGIEDPPYLSVHPGVIQMTPPLGVGSQVDLRAPSGRHSLITLGDNGVYAAASIQTLNAFQLQFGCGTARMYLFSGAGLAINAYENTQAFVVASMTGARVAVVRQGPQQVGSMLELQDVSKAVMSRFDKAGYFMTRKVAAPSDSDLANGEMSIWFESKLGASRVMFKAKDASGTVVVGSVALEGPITTTTTGPSAATSQAPSTTVAQSTTATTAAPSTTTVPSTTTTAPVSLGTTTTVEPSGTTTTRPPRI